MIVILPLVVFANISFEFNIIQTTIKSTPTMIVILSLVVFANIFSSLNHPNNTTIKSTPTMIVILPLVVFAAPMMQVEQKAVISRQ